MTGTKTGLIVCVVGLVLGACAGISNEPLRQLPTDAEVEQYNASVPPDEHIVCRMERSVRSNIPRRVCRYVKDIAETSAFHREQLRRVLQ
jgi:hypothetical protein